eukprot:gb/GECG01003002.1/.p1 GENE.gb/GECG01003002.1/~~gb/GECG01003002.1/.p1  ORF type:complete len:386 (+),score=30.34 gb/GECG01003002.1/:1-1158(+)
MVAKGKLFGSAGVVLLVLVARWASMSRRLYKTETGRWMSSSSPESLQQSTHQSMADHHTGARTMSAKQALQSTGGSAVEREPRNITIPTSAERTKPTSLDELTNSRGDELIPRASLGKGKPVTNESQIPEMTIATALNQKLMTVVSGYFEVPGMPHHSASYFMRSIPSTLRWLRQNGANIVYYHNLDLRSHPLGRVFQNSGAKLRKVELDRLPGANVSKDFRELCIRGPIIGKRGNKCYYLHQRLNKFDSYYQVLSVWFSKLPFLDAVIRENPFHSVYFGWFDCGILSRLGPGIARQRLRRDSVGTPRSVMHYGPEVRRVGHRMGIFAGPGHKVQQIYRLHRRKIHKIFQENVTMCYDEEIVLAELLRDEELQNEAEGIVHYLKK